MNLDAESRKMMMVMLEDSMWLDRFQQRAIREADSLKGLEHRPCHRVEPVMDDGSAPARGPSASSGDETEKRTASNDSLQFNIQNLNLDDGMHDGMPCTPVAAVDSHHGGCNGRAGNRHCLTPEAGMFLPAPEFISPAGVSCVASETFGMVQRSGFGGFSRCSSAGPVLYTQGWSAGQQQIQSHDDFVRRAQSHE